jgi:hypothetical protein
MTDTILDQDIPEFEEPKFSGLLGNIFSDGTIEYDGQIGAPEDFPLTEAELAEVLDPGTPAPDQLPTPSYLAFWDALMVSTVYGSIREQSFVSLPMNTLATEFIALIGDAKAGRANEAAIQSSIDAILTTGTFTEDHLSELQSALVAGNLENIYVLG